MFFRISVSSLIAFCVLSASRPLYAIDSLGDVHFQISCKPDTQPIFDSGIALLHSFEFREAESAFHKVEKEDPKCVIAAWGVALSTKNGQGRCTAERPSEGMGGVSAMAHD